MVRFNEEQIVAILKEHEASVSVSDLYRNYGALRALLAVGIYEIQIRFSILESLEGNREEGSLIMNSDLISQKFASTLGFLLDNGPARPTPHI